MPAPVARAPHCAPRTPTSHPHSMPAPPLHHTAHLCLCSCLCLSPPDSSALTPRAHPSYMPALRTAPLVGVSSDIIRHHLSQSPAGPRGVRMQVVASTLNERKSLASIYIMCRALIASPQSVSKDGLGEGAAHILEELTFEQSIRPDMKMLTESANHWKPRSPTQNGAVAVLALCDPGRTKAFYESASFKQYVAVNECFADRGRHVWVNDYHLMLLPAMLRAILPGAPIGFFMHVAFPSSKIFCC